MNADDELLASAYLDGELTDEERRIAESDPAVMAEVEQLRALRAELADVEPPSVDARERALAAALGAFDEVHATAPAPSPVTSPVVDISRRRDPMRWLGAAAAVLMIGLLGVVVVNGFGGGDDDAASDTTDEPTSGSALEFSAAEPAEPADQAADATLDADAADGADRVPERVGDAEAEMATDDAVSELAESPTSEPAAEVETATDAADDLAAGSAASVPAALEFLDPEEYLDGEPITLPEELAWVARHLLDLIERRELPPTPNHSCPFPDVLSRGVLVDGDDEVDIYIAVSPATGTVLAIDQENCRVLLTTALTP